MKQLLSITRGTIPVRQTLRELAEIACQKRLIPVREMTSRGPGSRSPHLVLARDEFCYLSAAEGYPDKVTAKFIQRTVGVVTQGVQREIRRGRVPPAEVPLLEHVLGTGEKTRYQRAGIRLSAHLRSERIRAADPDYQATRAASKKRSRDRVRAQIRANRKLAQCWAILVEETLALPASADVEVGPANENAEVFQKVVDKRKALG